MRRSASSLILLFSLLSLTCNVARLANGIANQTDEDQTGPVGALQLVVGPALYTIQGFVLAPGGTAPVQGCWVSTYDPISNSSIGSWTDASGHYNYSTTAGTFIFDVWPPPTLPDYAHYQELGFIVSNDITKNVTLVYGTRVDVSVDRISVFSGTRLTVEGTVRLTNGTTWNRGQVTVYIDGSPHANATLNGDGFYLSVIQVPLSMAFGSHSVRVELVPNEPWIGESQARAQVYVYNTPLIMVTAVIIVAVPSFAVYRTRRKRPGVAPVPAPMALPLEAETYPLEKYPLEEETGYSPETLTAMVEAEHDHSAKTRKSHSLAQDLIDQKLGETRGKSETHWEYFHRVTKKVPNVEDSLKRLSELFESAEYSQAPMGRAQSEEAMKLLLRVREEIGGQNEPEYRNEYQA